MVLNKKIKAMDTEIRVILSADDADYICLTDMARFRDNDPAFVIGHWMRNRSTIDYLGLWESINNPDFKPTEFGRFREESGYNIALFGCTAKDWQEANPELSKKFNMRDAASINQLVVLSNIESANAEMLKQDIDRTKRFQYLQKMAKE